MLPEVEEKVKPKFEEFRRQMRAEGYSDRIIERGLERARGYVEGVTKMLDGKHPELVARAQEEMIPEALEHSKRWIRGLVAVIRGSAERKYEEVVT